MERCIGIVKKTGAVCGCKARYEGLYCGRHKAQCGGKTDFGGGLFHCFVCCTNKMSSVTMPCCGQKLCSDCTIKHYFYADSCAFCRHKLKLSVIVQKK